VHQGTGATINRHGAGVARRFTLWAHNSEVAGIHWSS